MPRNTPGMKAEAIDLSIAAAGSKATYVGAGAKGVKDGFCTLKSGAPSTITRLLNAGDYAGACAAILAWGNYKGKPLRGLMLRRQQEYQQCMGGAT